MEFKGSSKTVAKRIFTVIKEDEDYFCEVRQLLLDLLKERNSRVIKKIEPALLAIANAQAN